jgi:hypothetical protein
MDHCINCLLDSVSYTRQSQRVSFEDIVGQRGVFACEIDGACTGDPENPCAVGYEPPTCALCASGWSRPGFKGPCKKCGGEQMGLAWIILATVAAIGLTVGVLYFIGHFSGADALALPIPGCGKVLTVPLLISFGKIGLSHIQILTTMSCTMEITWPQPFHYLIDMLKVFSMDWLSFLDVGCVASYTYYHKFTFSAILLPILLIAVSMVYCVELKRAVLDKSSIIDRVMKMVLTVIFLVYPVVSQTMFQSFSCYSLDDDEQWLHVDPQISCVDSGFEWFRLTFGIIGVCAYPLAIPVLTMFVLLRNFKGIMDGGSAFIRYDFLVADYKPQFFYWDVLDMGRKTVIAGVFIFFNKGSVFQVCLAAISSVGFGVALSWVEPYVMRSANMFRLGSEAALSITVILAVMLKVDLDREGIDETTLGLLLTVINIAIPGGTLLLGVMLYGLFNKEDGRMDSHATDFDEDNNHSEKDVEFNNPVHDEISTEDHTKKKKGRK